ncbi:MAG TPA: hypothetical protein DCZ49_04550, partial [Hyphomonadaceae bacterium]|nr:hypothetical protein [Hyphomonadaceae bacterium]
PFGLYDMHGNVWEWVEDCWRDNLSGQPADGSAYTTQGCSFRVNRGGSWNNNPQNLRSANRNRNTPTNRNNNLGFRLARTLFCRNLGDYGRQGRAPKRPRSILKSAGCAGPASRLAGASGARGGNIPVFLPPGDRFAGMRVRNRVAVLIL